MSPRPIKPNPLAERILAASGSEHSGFVTRDADGLYYVWLQRRGEPPDWTDGYDNVIAAISQLTDALQLTMRSP